MSLKLIIAVILGLVVAAILVEVWLKRGKAPRPLAMRMKDGMKIEGNAKEDTPLGMEATDMDIVENAQKMNERAALMNNRLTTRYRSNRRNK